MVVKTATPDALVVAVGDDRPPMRVTSCLAMGGVVDTLNLTVLPAAAVLGPDSVSV